jgi:transposase-like protein
MLDHIHVLNIFISLCEDVFRHTVSEATSFGVNVCPIAVYSDFETAIHKAVTTVWPGCEVKACRFHLGQRRWRKIQGEYKLSEEFVTP